MGWLDDWFGKSDSTQTVRPVLQDKGLTGVIGRGLSDTLDFAFGEGSLGSAITGGALTYNPPQFQSQVGVYGPPNPTIPSADTQNPYGVVPVVQKTVEYEDAVQGDERMRNRVLQQSGLTAEYQGNNLLAQLEHERAVMQARRDAAISAAGRGAGAPYGAAIARLDRELEKTKGQLGRMGPLFDNKREINRIAFSNADRELQVSADEALREMDIINERAYNDLSRTFSDAQASAAGVMDKIGADAATRAAVAQEVGALEDEIMNMDQVDAKGMSRILQASEDLAVASAKAAGANTQLELTRNQIMVESDLKEKINNMVEDRKQQIQARNAAVSAARDLAAARWPADQPLDRGGFASAATSQAIGQIMGTAPDGVRGQVEQLVGLFSSMGVKRSDVGKILRGDETAALRYGIDIDFDALPSSVLSYAHRVLPVALDTYTQSAEWYDKNVSSKDPWDLPAGSATQAMAAADRLGLSDPEDRMHAGREYADMAEQGKDLSALNKMMGGR